MIVFVIIRVRVALTEDGVPMSTLREIALLKQLDADKHPNIVKWVIKVILLKLWFVLICIFGLG